MELSDDHFGLLVECVEGYAIYVLDQAGTVRRWNASAQRLQGYAASEIVGSSFTRFFCSADREQGKPARLLAAALRSGRIEDVGWRVRKDGTQFWASAVLTALRDHRGGHVGFAEVTRDLTDRSYRAFVEATHAIVWTTDASGHPNADSPSWRAFTGQTEAEWRGLRGWDPVHPEDVGALRSTWSEAKALAKRFEAQFRLRRWDGELVWMEVCAIPFVDSEGDVREWVGVTFDISDRKRAELQTKRALELWTTTLRSIGDAVISTDASGRVRFMNPIAERLTGWSEREATARALQEVFPIFDEETGRPIENPVHEVLRKGVTVGLASHAVLRRRDGQVVPINDSAAPIRDPDGAIDGVVLVFRDASEDKRELMRRTFLSNATTVLIEAADHRDALARIAQLAVPHLADWATVDVAEGDTGRTQQLAVAHVDPEKLAYARELERRYPPNADATTGVPSVMRTGRAELYPEISQELLEISAVDDEHRRILRALDLRSALVVPLRGKGPVFGAITFVYAGSERRYTPRDLELAEELARRAALIIERRWLEEQAEHANRMKDEFLATMSHELRTPLQAILGYASMLERGVAREPAKAIAAIAQNAAAQMRLVEDILDVSRITSGKLRLSMSRVELAAPVRAAFESMRPAAAARRIQIVDSLPPDLGAVSGDFERLQQILWNLLSNAVKFTEPGGVVEVRGERAGATVRVSVRDTGQGIAPEHLSVIFERFRQLDSSTTRQRGGLGLGLAIVQYLTEAHGGSVTAESAGPGSGATFTVSLPAYLEETVPKEAAHMTEPADEARPLRGIRVLVVEDDDDTREILGVLLSEEGASVIPASSAAEALAHLRAEPPHVLISDIGMPFEDGFSLLRRVRSLPPERGGNVPAIALTAYARREDVRKVEDAGFQLHVAKPIQPERLFDAVRLCVRGRLEVPP